MGIHHEQISRMTIWGNHSSTQYPDISNARVDGKAISGRIEPQWLEDVFIPTVQQRGAAIIKARGASSAASAGSSAVDHMRDWVLGSSDGDWVSMAICSDGSYGIEPGLMYSFPVTCKAGKYEIVQGLEISDFSRARMQMTEQELSQEKQAVAQLL